MPHTIIAPHPLDDLIARLEDATEPNWSLSIEVAVAVGWTEREVSDTEEIAWLDPEGRRRGLPHFTESIDDALTTLPEWASAEMTRSAAGPPPFFTRCILHNWHRMPKAFDADNEWRSEGSRPLSLNIVTAALKARRAMETR